MLGVVVERDTGHAVEGGFLRDIARVGDDTLGMGREPAKLEVAQRLDDLNPSTQLLNGLARQSA